MPDPSTIFFFLPNVKSASQWPNTITCPYSTPNSPDWQVQSFLTTHGAHRVPSYLPGVSLCQGFMHCPSPYLTVARAQGTLPLSPMATPPHLIYMPGESHAPLLNKVVSFPALISLLKCPTTQIFCQKALSGSSQLKNVPTKFTSISECHLIWK